MLFSVLLMVACESTTITSDPTCAIELPTLSTTTAAPGESIVLTTTPLTEVWDTVVTVGSLTAEIVEVDRSTCDDCDDCRDTGGCASCGECDACTTACDTCVETLTFIVPDLAAGEWPVELVNRHGRSESVLLTVSGAAEAP
ncbi:MAG: hypothetical protein Q8P41_11220 [Pseudomonadota bacterium]|nr:hypothetical protein [Pseudomonadota bacterium]